MKYRSSLYTSAALLAVALLSMLTLCKGEHDHASLPASASSDGSLYDLNLQFKDQRGRTIAWQDLRGKKTVMALFYTRCASVCPRIIADMKRVQDSLPPAARAEVRFVALSFDGQDTPEILADYASRMHLDESWTLLGGTSDSVQELAAALGFQFRKHGDGQFTHSAIIYLLDEEGAVVSRKEGAGQSIEDFSASVAEL
ncbi:MAG: SCO family protein [Leptospirales bacterium]|nr:SCO family protein [Leptospirales bacterium]